MIRLGLYSNDLAEKVQTEAQAMARVKLIELIKETFLEMATLFELKGAAYDVLDNKLQVHLGTHQMR